MNHEEIKEKYSGCVICSNVQNGKKVFGSGNLSARVAVVGEGPGKDEVAQLTPFVGPAGKLLNKILLAVGLKRDDIFFTNAILCRTDEKNRTPTRQECLNCRNRLFEELSLVKPRYTLLVGLPALQTIFGNDYKIGEAHGQWHTMLSDPCMLFFSLYHPAWILHSVNEGEEKARKKVMWDDIRKFKTEMEQIDCSWYAAKGEHEVTV
jgi:uracil-DNA glycosylase